MFHYAVDRLGSRLSVGTAPKQLLSAYENVQTEANFSVALKASASSAANARPATDTNRGAYKVEARGGMEQETVESHRLFLP